MSRVAEFFLQLIDRLLGALLARPCRAGLNRIDDELPARGQRDQRIG